MSETIALAGGTGDLGLRIARAAVARGAAVRALVRPGTAAERLRPLTDAGAEPVAVDFGDAAALTDACRGAVCVVSALSGLAPVIVEAQGQLLDAAVAAGVPRFIPSDFSIDYTALPEGTNRNFDLRRQFRGRVNAAPIRATSVFMGAFADMLNEQMPLIVRPIRRVVYWNSADVPLQFTTKDDTAAVAAAAALDPDAPRDLHVAGSTVTAAELARIMSAVTGRRYRLLRAGSLGRLGWLIRLARRLAPAPGAVFPPWQGMQYLHNMFSGLCPAAGTDNARYSAIRWTPVEQVLARG